MFERTEQDEYEAENASMQRQAGYALASKMESALNDALETISVLEIARDSLNLELNDALGALQAISALTRRQHKMHHGEFLTHLLGIITAHEATLVTPPAKEGKYTTSCG